MGRLSLLLSFFWWPYPLYVRKGPHLVGRVDAIDEGVDSGPQDQGSRFLVFDFFFFSFFIVVKLQFGGGRRLKGGCVSVGGR